jgi:phospholipase C
LRRLHVRRVRLVHRVLAERCGLDGAYRPSSGSYTFRAYDRCRTAIRRAHLPRAAERSLLADAAELLSPPHYAWTDLTYLLHRHHVSWRYYVMNGTEPDCRVDEAVTCRARRQLRRTPTIWNPLPYFDTVRSNDQLGNIRPLAGFYRAARRGTLPAVSWVVPSGEVSDHPPSAVRSGQAFVTGLVNTIMRGPDWRSTAIFLSWDEWGGFYDHVEPPSPGGAHYGLRVPGLVISAYARRGYVDHQLLSHDSYVKFIEDDFLGGARLDPATDGRPDPRREIREEEPGLGDLVHDFDFTRPPRKPVILPGGRIY